MSDNIPTGPFGAPEPPEAFFIAQGWIRVSWGWLQADGKTPVYFVDVMNAYPPLKAWVHERTGCPQPGCCPPKSAP